MALGWKTTFEKRIPRNGISNWEIFAIAAQACTQLEWEFLVVDEFSFTATTPTHWTLSQEIITIKPEGEEIVFKSQGESLELYEAGRNQKNIEEHLLPAFIGLRDKMGADKIGNAAESLKKETLSQLQTGRVSGEKITFGIKDHEVTFFLILANIVLYFIMIYRGVDVYNPLPKDITLWGGNVKEFVAAGEWWRLVTNLFVHVGVQFLMVSLIGLYFIGIMVETVLGKVKFLIGYLTTGALASLASIYFAANGVTAGASGAIAGLYGILIAFATTGYVNKKFNKIWFLGVMAYLVFAIWFGVNNGIDNTSNLGGLIAGIIIGYLFYLFHFRKNLARSGGIRISIEVVLITALLIFLYIRSGKDDSLRFEKAVMKLNQIELKAMTQMQKLQDAEDNEAAAKTLKEEALPLWKNFQKEIDKTDVYRLDDKFNQKRKLLHDYAQMRIKQTNLIYKSISEDTDKYNAEIEKVSVEIEQLIDKLGLGETP